MCLPKGCVGRRTLAPRSPRVGTTRAGAALHGPLGLQASSARGQRQPRRVTGASRPRPRQPRRVTGAPRPRQSNRSTGRLRLTLARGALVPSPHRPTLPRGTTIRTPAREHALAWLSPRPRHQDGTVITQTLFSLRDVLIRQGKRASAPAMQARRRRGGRITGRSVAPCSR